MIATLSLHTFNTDEAVEYVDPSTRLWGISEGLEEVPNILIRDHLLFSNEVKEEYNKWSSRKDFNFSRFKKTIAPLYINQIIHDEEAMYDLHEIALAAQLKNKMEIALVGQHLEFLCVRSIIIGILQGAGYVKDYITDCHEGHHLNYAAYWDLVPISCKHALARFKHAV